MAPRRTAAPEPTNTSRGAGAPAPTSAAASAPAAGAFFSPGDEPAPNDSAQTSPLQAAVLEERFTPRTVREHVALEAGGSADVEVAERAAEEAIEDPHDLEAEIRRIRQFRKPLGAYTQKLALPSRLGYHRHWFNDVAGRIDEATANGWKHVQGTNKQPIARCVGTGRDKGALYAFAMEIPEVFWQEDQDARNRAASEKVEALKAQPFRAPSGTVQRSDGGKFYDPKEDGGSAGPISIEKH